MKERRSRFTIAGLVIVLLLFATGAAAQVLSGSIQGTVLDPQDLVIAGAKVTITDLATGKEFSTTTTDQGSFVVAQLPFGFYKVSIDAQGMAKFTFARVQVNVGGTAVLVSPAPNMACSTKAARVLPWRLSPSHTNLTGKRSYVNLKLILIIIIK